MRRAAVRRAAGGKCTQARAGGSLDQPAGESSGGKPSMGRFFRRQNGWARRRRAVCPEEGFWFAQLDRYSWPMKESNERHQIRGADDELGFVAR